MGRERDQGHEDVRRCGLAVNVQDIQNRLDAYMRRQGRATSTRYDYVRRVGTLARRGFPWRRFLRARGKVARRIAEDFLQEAQDLPGSTTDNWTKLFNAFSKMMAWHWTPLPLRREPPRTPAVALTPDRIDQVLDQYQGRSELAHHRTLCLFVVSVLLKTRRVEPTTIMLDHLDRPGQRIYVHAAKGGASNWMPVHADVWPYIEAWLDVRPEPVDASRALFTTVLRPYRALAPAGVYAALRSMGRQVQVPLNNRITRHTKARRDLLAGMPRETRKFTIRHRSESQLAVYEEFGFQDAAHDVQRFDPGLRGDPRSGPVLCPTCGQARTGVKAGAIRSRRLWEFGVGHQTGSEFRKGLPHGSHSSL